MDIYFLDINEFINKNNEKIVFKDKLKEKQHYAGRYLLSRILKENYSAEEFEISVINGKPYLKDLPCYFSISHSKNIVGIAVGKEELGFDIEYNKTERNYIKIFKRYGQKISSGDDLRANFYEFWTKHEAKIKLSPKFKGSISCYTSVYKDDFTYSVALKSSSAPEIAVHVIL